MSNQRFKAIHKIRSEDYLLQILPLKVNEENVCSNQKFKEFSLVTLQNFKTFKSFTILTDFPSVD